MLTEIHIRDLATIEKLDLILVGQTTMITGETGAGKSIFLEAIELALGSRASQNRVRVGKDKAEISLIFNIEKFPSVLKLLQDNDLYQDSSECIIRRIITHDGRSRCYINSSPCTLPLVKELGELLFHLHGQYEQQVLLKTETQRDMVDRFADQLDLAAQVKCHADNWKNLNKKMLDLQDKTHERQQQREFLIFQLDELNAINLKENEWESLEAEHHRLTHAEELIRHIQLALNHINENENHNVIFLLNDMRKSLESILSLENKAHEWIQTLQNSLIQLTDLESELKNYLEDAELDPEKLQLIESRVSQIFNLSRKYKIAPQELLSLKEKIQAELNKLNDDDQEIKQLEKLIDQTKKAYKESGQQLSTQRKQASRKLENEITATIRSLSLPYAEMKIILEPLENDQQLSPYGHEKIIFMIKTNPDQPVQPLAKVISGGELSRLSLAAHLALANRTSIPTLIFDEVDTGLSGGTAEKIGKLLRKLGESYQVFCVTHQPQVAACGHHHLLVQKDFKEKSTHTNLRLLNFNEKTKEIARMLGGEKMTEKTLAHAREVLNME